MLSLFTVSWAQIILHQLFICLVIPIFFPPYRQIFLLLFVYSYRRPHLVLKIFSQLLSLAENLSFQVVVAMVFTTVQFVQISYWCLPMRPYYLNHKFGRFNSPFRILELFRNGIISLRKCLNNGVVLNNSDVIESNLSRRWHNRFLGIVVVPLVCLMLFLVGEEEDRDCHQCKTNEYGSSYDTGNDRDIFCLIWRVARISILWFLLSSVRCDKIWGWGESCFLDFSRRLVWVSNF